MCVAVSPHGALPMTSNDINQLLAMAKDTSGDGRTALVNAVGDLFVDTRRTFTERESALMSDILGTLIRDVELTVRKALARKLAAHGQAPANLVIELANDEIAVAAPVLEQSMVIKDPELIAVISNRTREHQLAVTRRGEISEAVCSALVETGDEGVIASLLQNENAAISAATLEYLVEQSRRVDVFQKPLLDRRELSESLAKRMYWWVSAALRQHILDRFEIDASDVDQAIETVVKDVIADANSEAGGHEARAAKLVAHLAETEGLNPKFLIQVLREGEVPLFEAAFSYLTELPLQLSRHMIFEDGGRGLTIACKAIDIPKPDFASIFLLSRQGRPGEKVVDPGELSRALDLFDRVDRETAQDAIHKLRLDPDYASAIAEIRQKIGPNN